MNYFEDSFIRNGCDAQDPNDPNKHVVWSDAMVAWVCIDEYDITLIVALVMNW